VAAADSAVVVGSGGAMAADLVAVVVMPADLAAVVAMPAVVAVMGVAAIGKTILERKSPAAWQSGFSF